MSEENSKTKIFIADCNAELRKNIIETFKKEKNFEIVGESGDGLETFDLLKKVNADILIMDLVLPGLDGFALIENISKTNEIMKKPKIVVTSSLAHEGFINKAMQLGVNYFMIKPINENVLLDRVKEVCAEKTKQISTVFSKDVTIDHAFECVGSSASQSAIDQIIDLINPQGTINLFGVSEYPIPLNTRMVLEKGLTIQGNSRSEREDFVGVVETLKQNPKLFEYLEKLVTQIYEINSLNDLKEAFDRDYISRFGKTILKWNK